MNEIDFQGRDLTTEEVLTKIFGSTSTLYGLSEFKDLNKLPNEILNIFPKISHKLNGEVEKKYFLKCFKREKDIQVYSEGKSNPEEIVRQLYLYKLTSHYNYPMSRIEVEKQIQFGSTIHKKPADIIVNQRDNQTALIVIELKEPDTKQGIEQLKSYLNAKGSPIGVWTNGKEKVVLYRPYPSEFEDTLTEIPREDQTIEEMITSSITLTDLRPEFDFRGIVSQLEELVLANAGEDEFQEIFKLIFAKLYDEFKAKTRADQSLLFRKTLAPNTTYDRIEKLFESSCAEWPGIFESYEKIQLTPEHLQVCIGPLERIRLLGANMRVMDDAFEYLVTKVAKGEKGQYFTPRFVIDMCVNMLIPKNGEFLLDPACGSSGFLLHSLTYVSKKQLGADPQLMKDYAAHYLYGIDFDHRMAKIARALMLIAGDGKTHVFKLNSLNPDEWIGESVDQLNARTELKRLSRNSSTLKTASGWDQFREFSFDIIMTNPPFAGEIHDLRLLRNYELGKRNEKLLKKVERHILFIERCLNSLKPGGRMAIVLPQGIFNNPSLAYVRNFIIAKARILAVIGLHPNTFKPHTGTKTSVLVIQKLKENEKLEPNYEIFMAISEKGGKNNSGDYIYQKDASGNLLTDKEGNLIIDHDLETIASKFREFGNEMGFTFLEAV